MKPSRQSKLGFDALGDGYFGANTFDDVDSRELESSEWHTWLTALTAAKLGDFSLMTKVASLYSPYGEYRLNRQCMILIGDAGTAECFQRPLTELEKPSLEYDYDSATDYAHAVAGRGRLCDIPILLAAFERYRDVPDAEIIRVLVDRLLEREPGTLPDPGELEHFSTYKAAVKDILHGLERLLGPGAYVYRGELFDVRRLAERLLEALQRPYFSMSWRHKFEASTGIDCTGFYKNGELQPLTAAAIVENFLTSEAAGHYRPGVRYFFSHVIPD